MFDIDAAARKIADVAKATAKANSPRMHPDALALIWTNTYQAARQTVDEAWFDGQAGAR